MATNVANKVISDAFIVASYPEVLIGASADIVASMDALAAVGRSVYTITLDDPDHGPALGAALTTSIGANGYTVKVNQHTVVVS
jgi:hypothetical protein